MTSVQTNWPLAIAGGSIVAISAIHQYLGETKVLNAIDNSKQIRDLHKDVIRAIWNFSTASWLASGIVLLKIAFGGSIVSPVKLILDFMTAQFGVIPLCFIPGYVLKRTKPVFYFQIPLFSALAAIIFWGNKRLHV